jgi:hypothetical protein
MQDTLDTVPSAGIDQSFDKIDMYPTEIVTFTFVQYTDQIDQYMLFLAHTVELIEDEYVRFDNTNIGMHQ